MYKKKITIFEYFSKCACIPTRIQIERKAFKYVFDVQSTTISVSVLVLVGIQNDKKLRDVDYIYIKNTILIVIICIQYNYQICLVASLLQARLYVGVILLSCSLCSGIKCYIGPSTLPRRGGGGGEVVKKKKTLLYPSDVRPIYGLRVVFVRVPETLTDVGGLSYGN